jgi:hypothetical protein
VKNEYKKISGPALLALPLIILNKKQKTNLIKKYKKHTEHSYLNQGLWQLQMHSLHFL